MSQLLLVSADLSKIRRSATFKVQKGNYRLTSSDLEIGFYLIFGDGNRMAVKGGDSIPILEDSTFHMELPEVNKKVTVTLGRI